MAELAAASELFTTSARRGVVSVAALDGAPRGDGALTRIAREAYDAWDWSGRTRRGRTIGVIVGTMARKDARGLRDEAGQAATEGKHKRALECYVELEQLEPADPNWPKRAAEIYRRLGKNREAVAAYDCAAERYAQGGFLVQSIAVSKIRAPD